MEVGSSSLPGTTEPRRCDAKCCISPLTSYLSPLFNGGLAQLARAPALQAGGQRFESVILHSVCENADRRSQSAIIRNGLEIFDILTHKTVSKDFKLKTELYDSINSQFTAESMSYVTLV